jgi:hypothetical protein
MRYLFRCLATIGFCCALSVGAVEGQDFSKVVIWSEANLPAADSAAPPKEYLARTLPKARLTPLDQLSAQLESPETQLLILPQGSVLPESGWSAIYNYLRRGGNLLVLGGRPFTRAAYHDANGWHLRDYSVRFARPLLIDQYQETPGSNGEMFVSNPDIATEIPRFAWGRGFSPVMRLSTSDLYRRGGSAGFLDARLEALAWGESGGRRMSAPVLQIDHISSGFDGGRWILLAAELAPDFYSSADSTKLVQGLALRAMEGALDFYVRPSLPLYVPGEPVELEVYFHAARKFTVTPTVQVTYFAENEQAKKESLTLNIALSAATPAVLPAPARKGLQIIEARLFEGSTLQAIYRSAFWIRDQEFLRSGPRQGVNADYLTINGKPLAVVGTTYMSSEVQRLFFDHPNVYVWNRDLGLIHEAGLNMIRTGWWTGWDKLCDESGRPYERTLRTMEAYLMTARKYELPVQFNFFAFLPDTLGGANAFLDPQAVRRQQNLVSSVAARFQDVPFLAWDLINEPSFSVRLWTMRPNGDDIEKAAWNEWLAQRYPDRAALAEAWNLPTSEVQFPVSLPGEQEFSSTGVYIGVNSLRVYDYYLFAQEKFANWVRRMREAVRAAGSPQPITVGQDEGGTMDRLSPAFFAPYVDFTTTHSWWQNDHLLWDSLVAKQPGLAMLVQETGLQRELMPDEIARRTPEQEAMLFERKFVMSFVQGSGAIEWLWNSNAYMTESNETPIGALRPDGTEKPEATVLRKLAKFAALASPYLQKPKPADIVVVTSQAAQFSVRNDLQLAAQQNAVRAITYDLHLPCAVLAENQIGKLGSPRLVLLPSAQALREETWQALLAYVRNGGNLMVTGPVNRDEHWHVVDRLSPLGFAATLEPLTMQAVDTAAGVPGLRFDQQKQLLLEYWKFRDGSAQKELTLGKGRLYLEAYPVELARNTIAAAAVYAKFVQSLGIAMRFTPSIEIPAGVLIYPEDLEDGILYVFASETNSDSEIHLQDAATKVEIHFKLGAEHGALVLIDKKSKTIAARSDPELQKEQGKK